MSGTHRHRCLRCDEWFDCLTPRGCGAKEAVFSSINYLDAYGQVAVMEHCEEREQRWVPSAEFIRVTTERAAHTSPSSGSAGNG